MTSRPAVFLDRDGTIVEDPGYLDDPSRVQLIPGAARALARFEAAGYLRVIISNQSGIGRGRYDTATFDRVQREIERQLALEGALIDLTLFCPHLPDAGCPCRKPGTALHREAIARLGIDTTRSWCVGDRIGDVAPAAELGCHAVLVQTGEGMAHDADATRRGFPVTADLAAAADLILGQRPA